MFRKKIDVGRRKAAFLDIESDLQDGILAPVPIAWTNAFLEAEQLGNDHTETNSKAFTDVAARAET